MKTIETKYDQTYEAFFDETKGRWNFRKKIELMEVALNSLVGKHLLTGVDLTNHGHAPNAANVINFVLDGKTYTATENEDDGYRSSLDKFFVSDAKLLAEFAPVEVLCVDDKEGQITFYDTANGKEVLRVGTDHSDSYYPSFVSNWNPKNLSVNAGIAEEGA